MYQLNVKQTILDKLLSILNIPNNKMIDCIQTFIYTADWFASTDRKSIFNDAVVFIKQHRLDSKKLIYLNQLVLLIGVLAKGVVQNSSHYTRVESVYLGRYILVTLIPSNLSSGVHQYTLLDRKTNSGTFGTVKGYDAYTGLINTINEKG